MKKFYMVIALCFICAISFTMYIYNIIDKEIHSQQIEESKKIDDEVTKFEKAKNMIRYKTYVTKVSDLCSKATNTKQDRVQTIYQMENGFYLDIIVLETQMNKQTFKVYGTDTYYDYLYLGETIDESIETLNKIKTFNLCSIIKSVYGYIIMKLYVNMNHIIMR